MYEGQIALELWYHVSGAPPETLDDVQDVWNCYYARALARPVVTTYGKEGRTAFNGYTLYIRYVLLGE